MQHNAALLRLESIVSKSKKYQNYLDQKSPEKYPWAWEIILRRDLESDSYQGFTLELIDMVRARAEALVHKIHMNDAVTPKTHRTISDLGQMLREAESMANLSPRVATRGPSYVEVDPMPLPRKVVGKARSRT